MTVRTHFEEMKDRLGDVMPEFELRYKAELVDEILRLKAERRAVILAHNYMEPALFHSIPDHAGDSLYLCRQAAETDAEVIVFCGVRFMAETAKVLNPDKTVLLPATEAGCSLAESITADDVKALKSRFPDVPVVAYVNTSAEVKAEVDICCTSSNASAVVESLGRGPVMLVPDEYLARNVAVDTGRRFIFAHPDRPVETPGDDTLIGWPGRCEVHEKFTPEDVAAVRRQFPDVLVLAHPECSPDVVAAADDSGSTAEMTTMVERTEASSYLLLTECAMGDNIAAANPSKKMLRLCSVRCPHMNRITLEGTLRALRDNEHEVVVDERVRVRALRSIERMIALR